MIITDIKTPWRERYSEASFRGAIFWIEMQSRTGGRRLVMHQYPKRDLPYAEDMGRRGRVFPIVAFLIGPNYLDEKEDLIRALEAEGPGTLKLPMQQDQQVACPRYSIQETRDKGGFCVIEMEFVEQGVPGFSVTSVSSAYDVATKAAALASTAAQSAKTNIPGAGSF